MKGEVKKKIFKEERKMKVYKIPGYLTSKQFADLVGVNVYQLRRWDAAGKLIPVEKTPGGKRYYIQEQAGKALILKKNMKKRRVDEKAEQNPDEDSNSEN